jgi:nucleolar protein 56
MQRYWFGDVDGTECLSCTIRSSDGTRESAHIAAIAGPNKEYHPIQWNVARAGGCVSDRSDYISRLRNACFVDAQTRITAYYRRPDLDLIYQTKSLDALDISRNLLFERAIELYRVTHPTFSQKIHPAHEKRLIDLMSRDAHGPLGILLEEVDRLARARMKISDFVSNRASEVLPNSSALVGGLVAARLLVEAGDIDSLVRIPSATIQVLGARKALFAHVKGEAPSPKHGIIFQHHRIHNAPVRLRGRVARTLAAQLAIAIRLDYHRGRIDYEFLRKADRRIVQAGEHS